MRLYPDCDYYGDKRDDDLAPKLGTECEGCYRWEVCINGFMKDLKPIPIVNLPAFIGKKVWVQAPNIGKYGREAVVEDVIVDKRILYLVNDFTCHEYGRVWEAYPINEREIPFSYST